MTTNPAIAAAQALRLAANAVFDGLEVLAASLTATPTPADEPMLFDDVKVAETKTVTEKPARKAEEEKKPEPVAVEEAPEESAEDAKALRKQVRAALSELSLKDRREEARDLLKSFGVNRLPDVPQESLAPLLAKAQELLDA